MIGKTHSIYSRGSIKTCIVNSKSISEIFVTYFGTVKLNKFSNRTEPNRTEPKRTEHKRTELSRTNSILSRRTVREIFRIFWLFLFFFCKKFGSVRSNRTELHHLNASYSVNFEVHFDRIESNFLQKNQKVRVQIAVTNSYLIRFASAND